MFFRKEFTKATFRKLQSLYLLEEGAAVKTAYKLTRAVVFPEHLKLQNVSLAARIFHPSTIASLSLHGHCETATYLCVIMTWFFIFNVHRRGEDIRSRNSYRQVLSRSSKHQVFFDVSYL